MNTPAHVILGATILGRGRFARHWWPITAGSLLPDLPMFGFYAWERLVALQPERVIWSTRYFDPGWQALFDTFNSLPLIGLALALAAWRGATRSLAFFAAMAVHCLFDLPVHREDAHAHLFPLSDWRFVSPISYWDPRYHGMIVLTVETLVVIVGSLYLVRRTERGWRGVGRVTLGAYAIFAVFAFAVWVRGGIA